MSTARDRGERVIAAAEYRALVPEEDLEECLRDYCGLLHIVRIHHLRSRGTTPGVLDDEFIGTDTLYREIKTARGKVTPAQTAMIDALRAAGRDADVWRPDDFASGRVLRELRAISPPAGHPARAAYVRYRTAVAQQRARST